MDPTQIAAWSTAGVSIIGAITALIIAVKANGKATAVAADLQTHIDQPDK